MTNKILLITKNFPPQIGGIETYAVNLHEQLKIEGNTVILIKAMPRNRYILRNKKKFFIIYFLAELYRLSFFAAKVFSLGVFWSFHADKIWSLDGSICWMGWVLSKISLGKKNSTIVTLHALDVLWDNRLYQLAMPFFWRRMDTVICLNRHIEKILYSLGLRNLQLRPHKLSDLNFPKISNFGRAKFLNESNIPSNKKLLFLFGRFVQKKGFSWFLDKVVPFISSDIYHIVLGGEGPMEDEIYGIIKQRKILNITILGPVRDDFFKAKLFMSMDFLIMPTLVVQNDCEGYPIVLLEMEHFGLKGLLSNNLSGIFSPSNRGTIFLPMTPDAWIQYLNIK